MKTRNDLRGLWLTAFLTCTVSLFLLSCSADSKAQIDGGRVSSQSPFGPYLSQGLDRRDLKDERVLQAMSRVPRHRFVPEQYSDIAYHDRALPIGGGQTISQPFIVALMTQEANVALGSKVLEIGTGSGFQAAVLAELGAQVHSIEIVSELAESAKRLLYELGYENVFVHTGDGWKGLPEEAPFDAILVTASSPKPPATLLAQLANRGRLIIPIEEEGSDAETLMVYERDGDDIVSRSLGGVKFVPLTGIARDDLGTDDASQGEKNVLQRLKKAAETEE